MRLMGPAKRETAQKKLRRIYCRDRLDGNWQWLILTIRQRRGAWVALTGSSVRCYNPIGLCVVT